MSKMFRLVGAFVIALACSPAMAQGGFNTGKLFFGAGLSHNDLPGFDEELGWQIFGGYEFGPVAKDIYIDAEVGYMNAGDFERCVPGLCVRGDVEGLWATGVGRLRLGPQFELLGRLGLDFGDDDGLMFGVGVGLVLNRESTLRFEIVERDNLSSLQVNYLFRL